MRRNWPRRNARAIPARWPACVASAIRCCRSIPVSGELPFPDHLDRKDAESFARVWRAQLSQIAIPLMGLPALTVSTGLVGRVPVGVQLVSGRFREDLCLSAGEAIEAGGTPPSPIDPVR